MSKGTKSKKLPTTFAAIYSDLMGSDVWRAMTPNMRCLHLEMKALFNREKEAAVHMSERRAAILLGISRATAGEALAGLQHYGLLRKIRGGYLGINGCGIAAEWQMTDERYLGKPATLDFKKWDGTIFEPSRRKRKQKPGLTIRPPLAQPLGHPGLTLRPGSKKPAKMGPLQNRPLV
jgi:hypothetical protein